MHKNRKLLFQKNADSVKKECYQTRRNSLARPHNIIHGLCRRSESLEIVCVSNFRDMLYLNLFVLCVLWAKDLSLRQ